MIYDIIKHEPVHEPVHEQKDSHEGGRPSNVLRDTNTQRATDRRSLSTSLVGDGTGKQGWHCGIGVIQMNPIGCKVYPVVTGALVASEIPAIYSAGLSIGKSDS